MSTAELPDGTTDEHLQDAEYADETFTELFLEPTTADDRRGDWRAFEAREGGKPFELYDNAVVELLHRDPQFTITLRHRGSGDPWTPSGGSNSAGAADAG